MHILIAPNAFKNSLTALKAAKAIEKGLLQSKLDCTCECFPIADGGDGTGDLIIDRLNGKQIFKEVHDPFGRPIMVSFGLIEEGRTAVIEMASASGLSLLNKEVLDPLHVTTFGTGELIKYALDQRVSRIIIGLGGSATVDGGVGMVEALGGRFLNAKGIALTGMPESLVDLFSIDLSGLDPRVRDCKMTILCDVDNTLLGETGAATVFGPQKGATAKNMVKLEASLTRLSEIGFKLTGRDLAAVKYGGAAGGSAAGIHAFLNGDLVNGAEGYLALTGFEKSLQKADLVITGEGSIDLQTLSGKGPLVVAMKAKKMKQGVIGLAGQVPLKESETLKHYFDVLLSIGDGPSDLIQAMKSTEDNLIRTAREVGDLLALMND